MELLRTFFLQWSGIAAAALAVWILVRCAVSLLRQKYEPEVWGYVELPGSVSRAIHHWECILGRAAVSDIVLTGSGVERTHAAIQRDDGGQWTITDLSKSGILLNGKAVEDSAPLRGGDRVKLGTETLRFQTFTEAQRKQLQKTRREPGRAVRGEVTLLLLTLFQILVFLQHLLYQDRSQALYLLLAFVFLTAVEWAAYFMIRGVSVRGFEAETIAFFLTTVGFSVAASAVPGGLAKQSLLFVAAVLGFFALGIWLRDLRRARSLRCIMGFAALGFLGLTLFLSEEIWGAKNWLSIAGQSLQPSEFVKIAYVYAGSATLDRLFRRRNILLFICFSAVCVGALGLMGDFGTALVFFLCFLVISFLRSGSFATLGLAVGSAGLGVMLILSAKPYVARRFMTWGHAWETPLGAGFQQVRAMSATASGGLFGRGGGNGWLKDVVAADTDLVFGVVCEELGLIVGLCCVLSILLLAFFAVRSAATSRSSFYLIASCATVTIFMAQTALNVFGSLDLLPFTGVTFPFVSRGGSSLLSCWIMLAYVKAGDTRQSGSFALRTRFGRRRRRAAPAKKAAEPVKKPAPTAKPAPKTPAAAKKAPEKKPTAAKKTADRQKKGKGAGK